MFCATKRDEHSLDFYDASLRPAFDWLRRGTPRKHAEWLSGTPFQLMHRLTHSMARSGSFSGGERSSRTLCVLRGYARTPEVQITPSRLHADISEDGHSILKPDPRVVVSPSRLPHLILYFLFVSFCFAFAKNSSRLCKKKNVIKVATWLVPLPQ